MKYRAGILTLSDKGARGEREDLSGPAAAALVTAAGYQVVYQGLMSDELEPMKAELARLCDGNICDLLLTTGGTGFSPRDVTPEATLAVAERRAPGIAEAMRWHSLQITPRGMLSRGESVFPLGVPLLFLIQVRLDVVDESVDFLCLIGVDHYAGPLVDQEEVFVLIDDVQLGAKQREKDVFLGGLVKKLIVDI